MLTELVNKCLSLCRCYINTAMPPPVDIVKVAIEWPGANAQLIEMDQVCIYKKRDSRNISSFSCGDSAHVSQWLNL